MSRLRAPHVASMTWTDGLFAHWPVEPAQLRPHVPEPLALDVRDGRAWLSVLPFVLARAGLRFAPTTTRITVPEVNLRTYVSVDGTPGLYFFSVDLDNRWLPPLVSRTTGIACHRAEIDVRQDGDRVRFRSVRRRTDDPPARLEATYRPDGDPFEASPGSLDHWLAERRRLFEPAGQTVLRADVAHDPWTLRAAEATVEADSLFAAADLPAPEGDPRVRYCAEQPLTGTLPRWIRV